MPRLRRNLSIDREAEEEADAKNLLRQIQELQKGVPPPETPPPEPVAEKQPEPQEPVSTAPPAFVPPRVTTTPEIGDLVQIVNRTNRMYGMAFIVGDIRDEKAHGFYLMTGGRKEYVTASTNDIAVIGQSRIQSKNPCSPKWVQDHGL